MSAGIQPESRPFGLAIVLSGALLLALAAASYGLSFVNLGVFALPLALTFAACKALIVLFRFMDFGSLSSSAKLAAGAALFMLLLLLCLMLADVVTREGAPLPPPNVSSSPGGHVLGAGAAQRSQPC